MMTGGCTGAVSPPGSAIRVVLCVWMTAFEHTCSAQTIAIIAIAI
jgi:hypothetical protein